MTVELVSGVAPTRDDYRALLLNRDPWATLGFVDEDIDGLMAASSASLTIVARQGSRTVGFALTGADFLLGGYLRILVVAHDMLGQGIGSRLLAAFEQRAFERWPNAYLCVSEFNLPGQQFYFSRGYQVVGTLPHLLVPGHAEILLRKTRGPWRAFAASRLQPPALKP